MNITRRNFLTATPAALTALLSLGRAHGASDSDPLTQAQPHPPIVGASPNYAGWDAFQPTRVRPASPRELRILQFTDLHFFFKTAADDAHSIADMRRQVELHRPDLVVISGDLWHDNPKGRGVQGQEQAVNAFTSFGVPWTMVWGNHDFLTDYQAGQDIFQFSKNSVYAGHQTCGDYRIEVLPAGKTAEPALDLYFLNTNTAGLGAWQVSALQTMLGQVKKRGGKTPPAYLFFHMPIMDYQTRIKPDAFQGLKLEKVTPGREESSEAFAAISGARSIRACFCGHNHVNDYTLKADQVDLVYGRSTGYAGYGGDKVRKGAKLIVIDLGTGKYAATTVFADGSKQFA